MQTLRLGSSGSDVAQWQAIIGVTADGAFGPQTQAATVAWQSAHGLTADGVVGPMTWAKAQGTPSSSGSGVPVAAFPGFVALSASDKKAFVKTAQAIAPGEAKAPSWLAAIVDFESARTWSPKKRNTTSGATGLIQIIPSTARGLGTTTDALAAMSFAEQLNWVFKYFQHIGVVGKIHSLQDMYMAVFTPRGVGQPASMVLYSAGQPGYDQNPGLDVGGKGTITVGDVARVIESHLAAVSGVVLVSMGIGLVGTGILILFGYAAFRYWKGA